MAFDLVFFLKSKAILGIQFSLSLRTVCIIILIILTVISKRYAISHYFYLFTQSLFLLPEIRTLLLLSECQHQVLSQDLRSFVDSYLCCLVESRRKNKEPTLQNISHPKFKLQSQTTRKSINPNLLNRKNNSQQENPTLISTFCLPSPNTLALIEITEIAYNHINQLQNINMQTAVIIKSLYYYLNMNIEEPVFCIIHNYRRPPTDTHRQIDPHVESDQDQLDLTDALSTDVASVSSGNEEEAQSMDNFRQ